MNAFQRKFVGEVRRCEELEKTFSKYLLIILHVFIDVISFVLALSDLLYLPFSLPGAGDQSFPVSTPAGSPSPSMPDAFGPSAPRTYHHRGGEWEASQRAQRGGRLKRGEMINRRRASLVVIKRDWSWWLETFVFVCLTRCLGTGTASGLSWPSCVSTEVSWPGHTLSQAHRWLKFMVIGYYFF